MAAVAAALASAAGASAAGSVAYVDGGEVWVSSFDGAHKARLSAGEGDWQDVTASDGGRVLGIRREPNKIAQLSFFQLWGADGKVINQSILPYDTLAWSSYAAPVRLDLSADGDFLAFGYSGYTGTVGFGAQFYFGHNVITPATVKANLKPIGQEGYERPSMFGQRVVAAQGSAFAVQTPESTSPFATTWKTLLDVSGVKDPDSGLALTPVRADVAASGKLVAFELEDPNGLTRIGVLSIAGVDQPIALPAAVDCFIPVPPSSKPGDVSLSQDGTRIAWKDDAGVKVAGVPTTAADPCVFSTAPAVLSATGRHPSIGGSDVDTLRPPAAPPVPAPAPGGTPPAGTPSGSGTPLAAPAVKLPATLAVTRLVAGLALRVAVSGPGTVTASATVPAARLHRTGRPVVVATGRIGASAAGTVTLRLRLNRTGRAQRRRLRGTTLLVTVRQGGRATTRRVRLR